MTTETLFGQAFAETSHAADADTGWTFATQMSSSNPAAFVTAIWWSPPSNAVGTYDWRVYSGHIGETRNLITSGALGSYTAGGGWQRFAMGPVTVSGLNFMVAVRSTGGDNTYAYASGKWPHSSGSLSGPGSSGGAFNSSGSVPDSGSALFFMVDAEVSDSDLTEVSKSVDLQFDVRASVSKSTALQYDVHTLLSKSEGIEYDVRSRVSKSVGLVYDTEIGNEVTKSFHIQYTVKQRVSKVISLEYDVRAKSPKTVALKYNVRQKTYPSKVLSLKHSVRSRLSRSLAIEYGVLVPISSPKSTGLLYDVRKRVSQSVAIQYDLGIVGSTTVYKSLQVIYHSLVTPGESADGVITKPTYPDPVPPQIITTSFK